MRSNQANTNTNARLVKGASLYRHGRWLALFTLIISVSACGDGGGIGTGSGPSTQANVQPPSVSDSYKGLSPATADTQLFKLNFWDKLNGTDRCGSCHNHGGQSPTFVDETDVNLAYAQAITIVDAITIDDSPVITKVAAGHNCWLANNNACADEIRNHLIAWLGADKTASGFQLTAPVIKDAGDSKTFPLAAQDNGGNSFQTLIHTPLLLQHCAACHDDASSTPQSPFFSNPDVNSAYESARAKIDLDTPANSRFVVRLREEFHNCWSNDCQADANAMEAAIQNFAGAITPTQIDSTLVISKALTLNDAIIASSGIRHDDDVIALYEFKTGSGNTAYDSSGVEPALHLTLSGSYDWVLGYGIEIINGKAQGSTANSKKLHDFISTTGEYSVEAWLVPGNITQEQARIISYSGGETTRNFSLGQSLYKYETLNRLDSTPDPDPSLVADGEPILETLNADENLKATLQHVVMTFDPTNGRIIYVDGKEVLRDDLGANPDLAGGLSNWNDGYAFVLGHDATGTSGLWKGKHRLVAVHNRALTSAQIMQNYNVGVGQKYFMLFSIAEQIADPAFADSYILFEVEIFDNTSYLFKDPRFINLNADWDFPADLTINGLRLGINGKEAIVGQAFANIDITIDAANYNTNFKTNGQPLVAAVAKTGSVIALEKGPDSDEFFLTFEVLGSQSRGYTETAAIESVPGADAAQVSDIGMRTFDEINATMAVITGMTQAVNLDTAELDVLVQKDLQYRQDVNNGDPVTPLTNTEQLDKTFTFYRQQLPSVENIQAFLSSHQMGIAQMAVKYCDVLVETSPAFFQDENTNVFAMASAPAVAFADATERNKVIYPLLKTIMNVEGATVGNVDGTASLSTQPNEADNNIVSVLSAVNASAGFDADFPQLSNSLIDDMLSETACFFYEGDDDVNLGLEQSIACTSTDRTKQIVKATCAALLGSAVMLVQ